MLENYFLQKCKKNNDNTIFNQPLVVYLRHMVIINYKW